jgi:hypothetical protein
MRKSKQIKQDKTKASYLDWWGRQSALVYAAQVRLDSERHGIALPIDVANEKILLENTIQGLAKSNILDLSKTSPDRLQIFIEAWHRQMQECGIV